MARANHRRTERLARRKLLSRVIILSFIFVSIGLVFISRTSDERFAPLRNGVESTAGRLMAVVSAPFRGLQKTRDNFSNLRSAHAQNQGLRRENVQLRQYKFRLRALQSKVNQLESVLNIEDGLDIPDTRIAVRVISETRGPFVYSVLINAGRKAGIKTGYPVMNEAGMIGHVIRVGERSSRVLLLQDLNSRVSIMSQATGARAILIGKNDEPPEIAFFDRLSDWVNDDLIVTSGDDGVLPQGLPIGRVSRGAAAVRVILEANTAYNWAWVYPFEAVPTPEQAPAKVLVQDEALAEGDAGEAEP